MMYDESQSSFVFNSIMQRIRGALELKGSIRIVMSGWLMENVH